MAQAMGVKIMQKVIGISGKAGSGKGVASNYLVAGAGFTLVKFAGPLKTMMRSLGLGDAHIEGSEKEKPSALLNGHTPRWAMQSLGTEWGRDCMGEEFWVNQWHRIASDVLDFNGFVVADDVRFENEAAAIRQMGGLVIEFNRPGITSDDDHMSENGVTPDLVIINDGSVEDLCTKIDTVALG